jgi:hypothetical protein
MFPAKTNQTAGIAHSEPLRAFTRVANVSELTNIRGGILQLHSSACLVFWVVTPARGWIYVFVWTQACRQTRLPPSCLAVITNRQSQSSTPTPTIRSPTQVCPEYTRLSIKTALRHVTERRLDEVVAIVALFPMVYPHRRVRLLHDGVSGHRRPRLVVSLLTFGLLDAVSLWNGTR